MLKLDFKIGARLLVQDNIWIEIIGIHEGQVALGITAPQGVPVNREKVAISKGITTEVIASAIGRFHPDPDLPGRKPKPQPPKPEPIDAMEETLRAVRSAAEGGANGYHHHPRRD